MIWQVLKQTGVKLHPYNAESGSRVNCHFWYTYLWSTLAVASSMTSILLSCRIARARHTSCRWPTLKLDPDSVNRASKPPFKLHIVSFNWTCVYKSEYTDNSSFIIKSFSIYHTHNSFNIARNSLFWTTLGIIKPKILRTCFTTSSKCILSYRHTSLEFWVLHFLI